MRTLTDHAKKIYNMVLFRYGHICISDEEFCQETLNLIESVLKEIIDQKGEQNENIARTGRKSL